MDLEVTVQLNGEDVSRGYLYINVRRGQQIASFTYSRSYLMREDAFGLSPDLPLGEATIQGHGHREARHLVHCEAAKGRRGSLG